MPGQPPSPDMTPVQRGELLRAQLVEQCDLQGLDFQKAALRQADLRGVCLDRVGLESANFFAADLRGASLVEANLRHAAFQRARLNGAVLHGANMASARLDSAVLVRANLCAVDLRRAQLQHSNLQQADLRDADLRGASLLQAHLRGADLRGADLRDADVRWADVLGVRLEGAHINQGSIQQANWSPAQCAHLQQQGLVISAQPPPLSFTQPSPPVLLPTDPSTEGLVLEWSSPLSDQESAALGMVLACWRAMNPQRDAALHPHQFRTQITASDADELEAVALLLCEGRWAEIGANEWLQPAAIAALQHQIKRRKGCVLWIRKSDGLRPVLSW